MASPEESGGMELITKLLGQPGMMEKVLSVASTFLSQPPEKSSEPKESVSVPVLSQPTQPAVEASTQPPADREAENRKRLLLALRPYLGSERQKKMDAVLQVLQVMDTARASGLLKKGGDSVGI